MTRKGHFCYDLHNNKEPEDMGGEKGPGGPGAEQIGDQHWSRPQADGWPEVAQIPGQAEEAAQRVEAAPADIQVAVQPAPQALSDRLNAILDKHSGRMAHDAGAAVDARNALERSQALSAEARDAQLRAEKDARAAAQSLINARGRETVNQELANAAARRRAAENGEAPPSAAV